MNIGNPLMTERVDALGRRESCDDFGLLVRVGLLVVLPRSRVPIWIWLASAAAPHR